MIVFVLLSKKSPELKSISSNSFVQSSDLSLSSILDTLLKRLVTLAVCKYLKTWAKKPPLAALNTWMVFAYEASFKNNLAELFL